MAVETVQACLGHATLCGSWYRMIIRFSKQIHVIRRAPVQLHLVTVDFVGEGRDVRGRHETKNSPGNTARGKS